MDRVKKFREDHAEEIDKASAKARELAEQGKQKLEETRERFDEEQAKRKDDDGPDATPGANAHEAEAATPPEPGAGKPEVPADDGVGSDTTPPSNTPPPAPPAGSPPPPPPAA